MPQPRRRRRRTPRRARRGRAGRRRGTPACTAPALRVEQQHAGPVRRRRRRRRTGFARSDSPPPIYTVRTWAASRPRQVGGPERQVADPKQAERQPGQTTGEHHGAREHRLHSRGSSGPLFRCGLAGPAATGRGRNPARKCSRPRNHLCAEVAKNARRVCRGAVDDARPPPYRAQRHERDEAVRLPCGSGCRS